MDSERVYVQCERHGTGHELKVTWRRGSSFQPYLAPLKSVEHWATEVRKALAEIVAHVAENGPGGVLESLKKLTQAGFRLKTSLFTAEDSGQTTVAKVEKWRNDSIANGSTVIFQAGNGVHVPWGLMSDIEEADIPADADPLDAESWNHFWCLKYDLATEHTRITPDLSDAIPFERFSIVPILHEGVYKKASNALPDAERRALQTLMSNWELCITESDFNRHWHKPSDRHRLMFFFCHADETRFSLNESELISIHDLIPWSAASREDEPKSFIFLNGCSTAVGSHEGGFLEATVRDPFCGFIGTETKIPDVFALRFGTAFLRRFLLGEQSLMCVMQELRRQHFPLSLAYGLYAYPWFRLSKRSEKRDEATPANDDAVSPENFSTKPVGSGSV